MYPKPILLSWSGGKDCLMALQRLRNDPAWRVSGLLTTISKEHDRVAMHGIRRDVLQAQAEALGLPLLLAEMAWPGSNESYLRAWQSALDRARSKWTLLEHCAFGDIHLADVRAWREQQMSDAGWQSVFPLWGEDSAGLAEQFVAAGHKANLVCVDTEQLSANFCGRAFDVALLSDLPEAVDHCGEHGEFHTLAHGGPLFAADLHLQGGESVLRDHRFQFQDYLLPDA